MVFSSGIFQAHAHVSTVVSNLQVNNLQQITYKVLTSLSILPSLCKSLTTSYIHTCLRKLKKPLEYQCIGYAVYLILNPWPPGVV